MTTSLERVVAAIEHREADRVPFFLLVTLLGARELGMSIHEYFEKAENVVEAELRLLERYRHDCVSSFFYAAAEIEAWGGETFFREDGPPTSMLPPLRLDDINSLEPPAIEDWPRLLEVLKATSMLKQKVGGRVPIIGVVLSPYSMPVLQLGFDRYIEVMYEQPELFQRLMAVNEEFCVSWSNAQIQAGATAICYFDPVASTTITPREMYLKTGFEVARRTLARINGLTATHLASGRCLPIVDDLARTGTNIIGTSCDEDLADMKEACRGKLTILGNLNGIGMRRWTPLEAEAEVKEAIAKAGSGGGFILCDNHGEIPWQVSDEILMAISDAVHKWGGYPLRWPTEAAHA